MPRIGSGSPSPKNPELAGLAGSSVIGVPAAAGVNSQSSESRLKPEPDHVTPIASMASATRMNAALFAPVTYSPGTPHSSAISWQDR